MGKILEITAEVPPMPGCADIHFQNARLPSASAIFSITNASVIPHITVHSALSERFQENCGQALHVTC